MKRLREMETDDPTLARARELIAAAEPPPGSEAQLLRVRRAIEAGEGGGRGRRGLPALGLAALIALFGGSAFAAVRYLVERVTPEAVRAPDADGREAPRRAPVVTPAPEDPEVNPAEAMAAPAAAAAVEQAVRDPVHDARALDGAEPGSRPRRPERRAAVTPRRDGDGMDRDAETKAARNHDREGSVAAGGSGTASSGAAVTAKASAERKPRTAVPTERAPRADEPQTPAASEEQSDAVERGSVWVHRAVQALRRDGDPARAARLLDAYGQHYPSGPLAEEVLSLRIEAARALGEGRVRELARQYLRRYPQGRYAAAAREALGADTR